MQSSRVAIVVPVFNGEAFLRETLESAIGQTHENLVVIAVDDHSSDSSSLILSDFAKRCPNFLVVRANGRGPSLARNAGIESASADFISVLDQDDVFFPTKIERLVAIAVEEGLDVASSSAETIDVWGNHIGTLSSPTTHQQIVDQLRFRCCICHSTVVYRKAAVQAVGGYRPSFLTAHDYDLWMRLMESGARFGGVEERLVRHRLHASSHGSSSGRRGLWEKTHVLLSAVFRLKQERDPFNSDSSVYALNWNALESQIDSGTLEPYRRLLEESISEVEYRQIINDLNRFLTSIIVSHSP